MVESLTEMGENYKKGVAKFLAHGDPELEKKIMESPGLTIAGARMQKAWAEAVSGIGEGRKRRKKR